MSNDSVSSPGKASGGVHEQIESFLHTVMDGLMRSHDQDAAEQPGREVESAKREPVDGRPSSHIGRPEVSTGHLAIVGSRWLVEAAKL